jgi:GAF domain-containing protein
MYTSRARSIGGEMTGQQICRALKKLLDQGAGLEDILAAAVGHLHRSNPRYHWTGIYELYPDDILRLGPFIGTPTDHVFIAVGKGICGTAVAEKRNIVVPDVSKASNYLACSAATKSELVVLIRRGDRIFAQIDIDSHELDAFDPAAVAQVEQVADCLAEAYERSLIT